MKMCDLMNGQRAIVLNNSDNRRLRDLGLTKGLVIKCLFSGPFGDPTAYLIRDAIIAIRNRDAKTILVEVLEGKE